MNCPKCSAPIQIREPRGFRWRGRTFPGLVCARCQAIWDDPDDSFEAFAGVWFSRSEPPEDRCPSPPFARPIDPVSDRIITLALSAVHDPDGRTVLEDASIEEGVAWSVHVAEVRRMWFVDERSTRDVLEEVEQTFVACVRLGWRTFELRLSGGVGDGDTEMRALAAAMLFGSWPAIGGQPHSPVGWGVPMQYSPRIHFTGAVWDSISSVSAVIPTVVRARPVLVPVAETSAAAPRSHIDETPFRGERVRRSIIARTVASLRAAVP